MLVSGPLLNTLYFYFRHFLSTYWLISPGGGGGGLIYETDGDARRLA